MVPFGVVDVQGPYFHPMLARIDDNLGRRIEAHRLAVQQCGRKDVGIMAFDPGRDIDQQGKTGGMAFGEAIAAEPFQLPEYPLGKFLGIAFFDMPSTSFFSYWLTNPLALKVAMLLRNPSASAGVKPAATMAISMACS